MKTLLLLSLWMPLVLAPCLAFSSSRQETLDADLFSAIKAHHLTVARSLLDKGASANAHDTQQGMTVLITAVAAGDPDSVSLLLGRGADVHGKDKDGDTALIVAAMTAKMSILQLLLAHGAKVNAKGSVGVTALMWAAQRGEEGPVRLLLDHGAAVNAKSDENWTALIGAASSVAVGDASGVKRAPNASIQAVAKLLLEHGADVNALADYGGTPLMLAVQDVDLERLLLVHGARVNIQDSTYGETALINAASSGSLASARLLLDYGADVTLQDKRGDTALTAATKANHADVAALLKTVEQTHNK